MTLSLEPEPAKMTSVSRYSYLDVWVKPEGREYRREVYERRRRGGTEPLDKDPTAEELVAALSEHRPASVLEVGCGWGRLLDDLRGRFDVEGCDVSPEMLEKCDPALKVFRLDIAVDNYNFLADNAERWDVLFTRGVMRYLTHPVPMAFAMNNMLMLAAKKVLIWEWPDVCEQMRRFSDSPKFEYHPIERGQE